MKIHIINFGYEKLPSRAHESDAGADVHALGNWIIGPHETKAIPLGLGLILPDGYMACVYPRSGLSAKGIVAQLPPIDSSYRGEIHAIVSNLGDDEFIVHDGDRIGQLVITPVIIADFVTEKAEERGAGAFGSTGI